MSPIARLYERVSLAMRARRRACVDVSAVMLFERPRQLSFDDASCGYSSIGGADRMQGMPSRRCSGPAVGKP